ncbi:protein-L-isoaspartate(D-aspartate) O-methyltransferase [soil metagenome]
MSRTGRALSPTPNAAAAERAGMVEHQLRRRGSFGERVLEAMSRVPRECFVPEDLRHLAYEDGALPIGSGQTISQPFMVATICQLLELSGGERVLDVGTGSGYQAAVLAELAAQVVTIERVPELAERARSALVQAGYSEVEVLVGDGSLGASARAPFDGIAVAAAAPAIPPALVEQLVEGGRLVVPRGGRWGQRLVLAERTEDGACERTSVSCRFVPLVGAEGFSGGGS